MRQELSIRILLKLRKRLKSLALELDRLVLVFFATMYRRNFNVTVANLLGLGPKCHLVEFPSLAEDVQRSLEVFLAEVDLTNHLQNLAVRRMRFTQDLLVHFE